MAKHIAEYLTIPGRILLVLTFLLTAGGLLGYVVWVWDTLAPGSYPLFFFIFPVVCGGGLFFALGVGVLKAFGIAVFMKDPGEPG